MQRRPAGVDEISRERGTAQDVANVVLFFVSDLSGFVTGQWVRVNGGRL